MSDSELSALSTHINGDSRVRQAIVFGSVASGKARVDSDLDLALDFGHALTVVERIETIEDLARLTGRPVDLVDLQTVGEPLLGQILRHGKRLAGSDQCFGRLIARHLFDTADFMPLQRRILSERRQTWIGR